MPKLIRPAALVAALLFLTGCDLVRIGDYGDYGEFEATVEGALDLDIHGTAISFLMTDTNPVQFDLSLQRLGVDYGGHIGFDIEGVERAVGTYAIGPDDGQMRVVYDVDARTEQEFVATSGELVIREIQDADFFGSFAFEAVDEAGGVVTVEGTYRARKRTYPHQE